MINLSQPVSPSSDRRIRFLFLLVFLLSLTLRLALTLVNREANDPHMEVVELLLKTGSLPGKDDCWECFQPKLYHVLVAALVRAAALQDPQAQVLAAQLFSFVLGLLTLAVIWRFLAQLPAAGVLRLLAFGYVAFNPNFIGISAQATNDTLLIFFCTLALYQARVFLDSLHWRAFSLATLFVILAASTKTNGWVVFAVILLAWLVRAILDPKNRLRIETILLVYLLVVPLAVTLNPLNQYISNYQEYGAPVLVNINRAPPPALFAQTADVAKPGILSIQDGFLTFKFFDLLRNPYINSEPERWFAHRTSLWTQLYGRAHSLNFDNWPATWRSDNPSGFLPRRAIFVLALAPTALLLAGALLESVTLLRALRRKDSLQDGLWLLAFLGFVGFVALYAFVYREYPVMKAIFTYPALLAFPVLFLKAAARLPAWAQRAFTVLSAGLFGLYFLDVLLLIVRLA